MRILFLSRWYPYPPDNGSKIRVHGLLRGLCDRHEVTLISFYNPVEQPTAPPATGPIETHLCPYREFDRKSPRAVRGFLSAVPRFLIDTHSSEMEATIHKAVSKRPYDLVIASQLSMAAYHQAFPGIPAVFEEVELGIYQDDDKGTQTPWTRARRAATRAKHRRYIASLVEHFTLCTVVSDVERQLLAASAPDYAAVHVVPNSVDADGEYDTAGRRNDALIFTGSLRYAPNQDAMSWFIQEVLPAVRAELPGVQLTITGDAGTEPPLAPNVVLTGHVPDVRSLVAASTISVAPIRMGGGTRLKILEAMAVRTPVVATSKAAEGLDVRDGEHVLIADTPAAFAAAVGRLLRNPQGAREMADRAWTLCRAHYDSRVVVSKFLNLVEHAAAA